MPWLLLPLPTLYVSTRPDLFSSFMGMGRVKRPVTKIDSGSFRPMSLEIKHVSFQNMTPGQLSLFTRRHTLETGTEEVRE